MEEIKETEVTENVDELLAEEPGNQEIPMEDPAPAPVQEYAIKVDGKEVKAPLDQLLRWAEMGHGAPNKIGELSKKLKEYESKTKQYESLVNQYKPVDEFVKTNPQWWEHVQKSWQEKDKFQQQLQQQDPNNPLLSELGSVKQQLQDVMKWREEILQSQQQYKTQLEDRELDNQVQAVKKEFGDVPWDQLDNEGKSLEFKVLDHATKNGIGSFRAAFRDYYFDEIQKRNLEQGKKSVANEVMRNTKLGLLGESPTPKKGVISSTNVKGKTYEQLAVEALQELHSNQN